MRVLIGNDFSEELREDRGWQGWWVQRLIWFAEDGDILILPCVPDEDFFDYVTSLTGVHQGSLSVVVPPDDGGKNPALTATRLADPRFIDLLRSALAGEQPTEVMPLWPDAGICRLSKELGFEQALPGAGFMEQDGGRLVNSKSVFRAIARGLGVPVPQGAVCSSKEAALAVMLPMLAERRCVVLKQDYLSGGRGNEIVSPDETFRPVGARRVVPLSNNESTLSDYLEERFDAITGSGRNRIVIEEYHRDSGAFFAEFRITDLLVELAGTGELLYAPFAVGQIMPAHGLREEVLNAIVDGGRRLSEGLRDIGYRGMLSADAIVTPRGDVMFTEYNGRITGSTHIYGIIGPRVIGEGYGRDRLILERVWPPGWAVPSFRDAASKLKDAGLAYDSKQRKGVVLTGAHDEVYQAVMYCIAAEQLDEAWRIEREMKPLFSATV